MNSTSTPLRQTAAALVVFEWMKVQLVEDVQAVIDCNGILTVASTVPGSGVTHLCEYIRRRFRDHQARRLNVSSESGDTEQAGVRQLQDLHSQIGNAPVKWAFLAHNLGKLKTELSAYIAANDIQLLILDDAQRCSDGLLEALYAALDDCKLNGRRFGIVLASSTRASRSVIEGRRLNTRVLIRRELPPLKPDQTITALSILLPEVETIRERFIAKDSEEADKFVAELQKQTKGNFRSISNVADCKRSAYRNEPLTSKLIVTIADRLDSAADFRLQEAA